MGFSKHLRGALRTLFGPHNVDSPVSGRQYNDTEAPVYDDKIEGGAYADTGFNYTVDTPQGYDTLGVTASILGIGTFRSRITDDEYNEIKNFMQDTTNHKCELRIVIQNQRPTNRGHKLGVAGSGQYHPRGQTADIYTPGDLSDVANILGYRGEDAVNFGDYMLTGPTAESSAAPGYGHQQPGPCGGSGEAYINDLNDYDSTGANPYISGHLVAGGYPAILDGSNIKLRYCPSGTKVDIKDIIFDGPSDDPSTTHSLTFGFPVTGTNYVVNTNFMYFWYNSVHLHNGDIFSPTYPVFSGSYGGDTAPIIDENHPARAEYPIICGCFPYKKSIDGATLNNNSRNDMVIDFPILFQAIKTLKRRNYTTGHTYIPDSFNYTVALVFYTKVSGTSHSHGKVYDVIFDRLRVIDRYDVDVLMNAGDIGEGWPDYHYNHIRPSVHIIRGTPWTWVTYSPWGQGVTSTFSNVPASGISRHFKNASGPIYESGGMGDRINLKEATKSEIQNQCMIVSLTSSGSSIRYDSFVYDHRYLSIDGVGNDTISASYNPSTHQLTVAYGSTIGSNNTSPLLVFAE